MRAADMVRRVAEHYGVPIEAMRSAGRRKDWAHARHVAAWALRRTQELSYQEIGRLLGDRDHSTVIYAVGKVEDRRRRDWEYARELDQLLGRPTLQLERRDPAVADWLKECGL